MLAGIGDFLFRHKRKFFIGGGVIGGCALLSKYAEYKLFQLHDSQTHTLIERQKRRQHYEKTRQTANATALNLSSCLTKIVCDELEVDDIIQSIRNKSPNKIKLWQDLKVEGFSRCIATIYASSLVGAIVHTKLMLLGGYTYGDTAKIGNCEVQITANNLEKYLSHLHNFVESGLPTIIKKIRSATNRRLSNVDLDKHISLEQLEGIIKDIILMLEGENFIYIDLDSQSFKLQPWSQYIATSNNLVQTKTSEEEVFRQMTDEMRDVIDGNDFDIVVKNLLMHGLNHVLDYVSEFYPSYGKVEAVDPANPSNGEEASVNGFPSGNIKEGEEEVKSVHSSFVKSTLPLAKLIPVLSDLVHPCLSPAPGQLLQFVLLNEDLENLSFNVYEAFSTSV